MGSGHSRPLSVSSDRTSRFGDQPYFIRNIRPGDLRGENSPIVVMGGGDCIPYVSVYQYVLDISIFTSNVVYMDSVSSICMHIISHTTLALGD